MMLGMIENSTMNVIVAIVRIMMIMAGGKDDITCFDCTKQGHKAFGVDSKELHHLVPTRDGGF